MLLIKFHRLPPLTGRVTELETIFFQFINVPTDPRQEATKTKYPKSMLDSEKREGERERKKYVEIEKSEDEIHALPRHCSR